MTDHEIALDEKAGRSLDGIGQPLGPWVINGFKWFSSATDSDMAIALARTSKGIGAFYIPMRRTSGLRGAPNELNGIRIQRLKNKLGTRGLPTAELELKQARGWLIGEEGKGVKEISSILNITRLHAAAGNVSFWSRGLSVCRAFTKVRKARGRYLYQNAHHVSWMAAETVKYCAAAHFTFFGIALLGTTEMGFDAVVRNTPSSTLIPQDPAIQHGLLRLLTPVIKGQVSLAGVGGLRECMECLGGVGYCENNDDGGIFNLAKLFRDSVVNTIWEGTRSVMAEDVRRVIGDKRVFGGKIIEQVYAPWVKKNLDCCRARFDKECEVMEERLNTLVDLISESKGFELEYYGREVLEHLEAITSAVVLLHDGSTGDNDVGSHIASRYAWSKALTSSQVKRPKLDWKEESVIDSWIFLGADFSHEESGSKL